jgi:hypothetical protein
MTYQMPLACVVVAGQGTRADLIDNAILPSLAGFDEVVVVGTHHEGPGYRYLYIPDLTKTTNDALVKRDVGALAVRADTILFLSDDHAVEHGFAAGVRELHDQPWDVIVPSRWVIHPEHGRIRIPNGEENQYCSGHGGVFKRRVLMARPWSAQQHHRNWDLIASREQQGLGFRFLSWPEIGIRDLEPEREPWT